MVLKTLKMMLPIGNKQFPFFCKRRCQREMSGKGKNFSKPSIFFQRWLPGERGLTLVEVLLAVSILSIGIVGVLRAYAGSVSVLEAGQYSIDAVNVLKQKMADVEQLIIDQTDGLPSSDEGTLDGFRWEWDIQSSDIKYLNELTLMVSHEYSPRTFTLKTYVLGVEEEEK